MSYDIYMCDPVTKTELCFDAPHSMRGGTYAPGGTDKAWLNVTYNYGTHFDRLFGDKGIRVIYGMTGADSIPILESGIARLNNDVDPDYWRPTEGNARRSLEHLLTIARAFPGGVWDGD